jgi:tetratricopeptide (TPR) repeat protein
MQNIDLQIAEFKECSSSGQREKADKLLIDIKNKHPLHPKTSKLISDISSYEPSDDIKDRLSKEFNDGKFIRVINICGSMLSKTPYSIWLLHVIGLAFTKIKKFDEAREAFNRLLFLSPLNERGLTGLGNLFFETNQMRMAAKTFKKTIQHNGDKFEILVDLALALSESKSYLEALDFIEKLQNWNPNP